VIDETALVVRDAKRNRTPDRRNDVGPWTDSAAAVV
jgi:hypothetical protein